MITAWPLHRTIIYVILINTLSEPVSKITNLSEKIAARPLKHPGALFVNIL